MLFEELDYSETPLGPVSLRRREDPLLGNQVIYEVKLGDEFLMSSRFTVGERALASICLKTHGGSAMDVLVGGLGLGYTAAAALDETGVRSLLVVDALPDVIRWHREHIVPLGEKLMGDERCRLVWGDFFAMAADAEAGFDHESPGRRFDAILLDIDHSPDHWLNPGNATFYGVDGLRSLAAHLAPGGIFGMWSNDPPEAAFTARLQQVFGHVQTDIVQFPNPYQDQEATCTIYSARS